MTNKEYLLKKHGKAKNDFLFANDINEINTIVEGIHDKTLAIAIKNSTKYTINGFFYGSVIGFLLSSFLNKGKLSTTIWGGIAGGSIGYLISKNKSNE